MELIILALDLYILAHVIWWIIKETNHAQNSSIGQFLSEICEPFCKIFRDAKLTLGSFKITLAVPVIILTLARVVLSASL